MNKDEMDLLNTINDRTPKIPIFKGDAMLQGVFDKVVGKTFRMDEQQAQQQRQQPRQQQRQQPRRQAPPRQQQQPRQQMHQQQMHQPPPGQMSSEQMAQRVIQADQMVRQQMQELITALGDLGDREIALKLISDHIFFLNDIFKDFEGNS